MLAPTHGKKRRKMPMPECKPRCRLERRPHGLAKHHIGEEQVAHPDHGGKDMEHCEDRHAHWLSTRGLEERSAKEYRRQLRYCQPCGSFE